MKGIIGVVGYGYVGRAVEFGFRETHTVLVHDKYLPSLPLERLVGDASTIFVCVPTPMDSEYHAIDLSIVEEAVGNIVAMAKARGRAPAVIIKSTVIPGTTRRLSRGLLWPRMLFNPEFLTEANYLEDFVNPDRVIIGGDHNDVVQDLVGLYRGRFPSAPIFRTDPTTAEMVKYMANTFLATKVIFGNEMYDLCSALGIRYEEVKKMVVADRRIYNSHLDVTTVRGFGGKCFPKDAVALLGLARQLGVDLSTLRAAWEKNLAIRKVKDWEEIPGAVSRAEGKKKRADSKAE